MNNCTPPNGSGPTDDCTIPGIDTLATTGANADPTLVVIVLLAMAAGIALLIWAQTRRTRRN